jgi:hypothetical protein
MFTYHYDQAGSCWRIWLDEQHDLGITFMTEQEAIDYCAMQNAK